MQTRRITQPVISRLFGAVVVSTLIATFTAAPTLAISLTAPPSELANTAPLLHKIDVIGKDERVRVPRRYRGLAESIGFLWQRGSGRACTAFCVGDALIATNAHCLVRPGRGLAKELNLFRFLLAPERGAVSRRHVSTLLFTDANQPLLSFYTGKNRRRRTLSAMSDDWAFAKLAKPLCRGKALPFAETPVRVRQGAGRGRLPKIRKSDRIVMIAYHGDRDLDHRWLSRDCTMRPGKRPGLLFHTCDSFKGSSGAPIMRLKRNGSAEVVAINVGTYELSRYRVTKRRRNGRTRTRRRLVKRSVVNVGIAPYQFAHGISRFEREDLLSNVREFREVQTSLRVRRLYGGAIDGIMGPMSRRALMRFEELEGLPALGLPTRQTRDRLRQDPNQRSLRNGKPPKSNATTGPAS
ncbi:MAG: peptidoglycan-binding protein [Pseudomonadota bacterium]